MRVFATGQGRKTDATDARHVLDVEVPQITIPVAPGRNLAVLLEAAPVRREVENGPAAALYLRRRYEDQPASPVVLPRRRSPTSRTSTMFRAPST